MSARLKLFVVFGGTIGGGYEMHIRKNSKEGFVGFFCLLIFMLIAFTIDMCKCSTFFL